jgi:hypothetical protein
VLNEDTCVTSGWMRIWYFKFGFPERIISCDVNSLGVPQSGTGNLCSLVLSSSMHSTDAGIFIQHSEPHSWNPWIEVDHGAETLSLMRRQWRTLMVKVSQWRHSLFSPKYLWR